MGLQMVCRAGHGAALAVVAAVLIAPLASAPAYARPKHSPPPTPSPSPSASASSEVVDCYDPIAASNADGACTSIQPTFSCVWDNGGGSYTAVLGYSNPSTYTLEMPVGTYVNSFYGKGGDPNDWGQPSSYPPGTVTTAYTVTWTQPWQYTIKWQLGLKNIVSFSSASTPACKTKPVPIVASVGALGAAVLVMMAVFGIANRRAVARQRTAVRVTGGPGTPRGSQVVSPYPGFDDDTADGPS